MKVKKFVFGPYSVIMITGLRWLRIGFSAGFCVNLFHCAFNLNKVSSVNVVT
jgi:hypothetical protein